MKKILVINHCTKRGKSLGLIYPFMKRFDELDYNDYEFHLYDNNYFDTHNPSDYPVKRYFCINRNMIDDIIDKIPKVRAIYARWRILNKLRRIFARNKYDLVIVYSLPFYTEQIVDMSHHNGAMTFLFPWGTNDIIDRPSYEYKSMKRAFNKTEYAGGSEGSNCVETMIEKFSVPKDKLILRKRYLKKVGIIKTLRETLTRKLLSEAIHISPDSYNIVCGYNAYPVMRHEYIIETFSLIKDVLPKNYLLVFPVTYPDNEEYIEHLKQQCEQAKLRTHFITNYLSDEQIAGLHIITDLFINIQFADSGNAYQIEELFCGNKIITGKWLKYKQFEQFGAPYYLLNSLEDLEATLRDFFTGNLPEIKVPPQLIELYDTPIGWNQNKYWTHALNKIFNNE